MDCIFCKIIAGELPAYVPYEDDLLMVIMDRFPASPGHLLIIPKRHTPDIYGLTLEESAAVMPLAQKLAKKIRTELNPVGLNILQNNGKDAGQTVFHYHLQLIPRYANDGVKLGASSSDPPLEELAKMADRLRI